MEATPCKHNLSPGTYFWCSCGASKKLPFCDGAHKKNLNGEKPIKFTLKQTAAVSLCNCRQSKNAPFCDGSHKSL